MKAIKRAILLLFIIAASTNGFAKSPHESESLINNQIMHGKIAAGESNHLISEVIRLTRKLERTLGSLPLSLEHNEGKIISIISNQVERELEVVKKDIDALNYQKSSDSIYLKLEQIEKDIEMI